MRNDLRLSLESPQDDISNKGPCTSTAESSAPSSMRRVLPPTLWHHVPASSRHLYFSASLCFHTRERHWSKLIPPSALSEKKNVSQWWLLFGLRLTICSGTHMFHLCPHPLQHFHPHKHVCSPHAYPLAYITDIATHLDTSAQPDMHIIMNIQHRQLCEWVDKWKGTWLTESALRNLNDKDKLGENYGWIGSGVLTK